jgi:hypothetical protein
MSTRLRLALAVTGLIILCCALLALGYALWPIDDSSLQSTLAPTLFTPP